MKHGAFKIIRVDGTETVHEWGGQRMVREIARLLNCDSLDMVTIDRKRQTVMFVDDTGMLDGKPVNPKATELYHAVCRPGTVHEIHGDVAIVNNRDFA